MLTPRHFAALLGAALAVACSAKPLPEAPVFALQAAAGGAPAAPAPFTTAILNPCNGEVVSIAGTVRLSFETRTDGNGGSHTVGRIFEHGKGTGAVTGATYTFTADSLINVNAETVNQETSQVIVIRLIGQGQAPNFLGTQILHFTINANGDLVGVVDDFRTECR